MGNQLCPAATKDIIHGFQHLEKKQNQYDYQPLLKCCGSHQTQEEPYEFQTYQINPEKDNPNAKTTSNNSQVYVGSLILQSNNFETQSINHKNILEVHAHQTKANPVVDLILPNGWKYRGQAVESIPSGKGEEIGPSGEYYSGNFRQGKKEGYGIYKFGNGSLYKGQFKDNFMWGHGTFQFSNGDSFEGEFVKNKREGKGKYKLRQPNINDLLYFEGQYRNDMKNVAGVMKYAEYEVRGYWKVGVYDYSLESKQGEG